MIKSIAVINKSTVVNPTDFNKMVTACNLQLSRDVAPVWSRISLSVTSYVNESLVPASAAKIYIFDNADQAGALGYHSETMGGLVFGKVFAKTITDYGLPVIYDSRNKNSITVSSVLSHEVIELFVNPYVELWADGPTIPEGNEYAFEACDAVEGDMYQVTVTVTSGRNTTTSIVSVSNFLYPEYFDTASTSRTKMDYMGKITAPCTLSTNGYMIVRTGNNETAVYGAKYPKVLKEYNKL